MRPHAAIVLALAVTGCATPQVGDGASPIGEWRVTAINGEAVAGPSYAMSMTRSHGTAQFGCNRGSGDIRATYGKVSAGLWAVTEMACAENDRMRHEAAGFRVLSQPMRVTRTPGGIRLTSGAGSIDLAP